MLWVLWFTGGSESEIKKRMLEFLLKWQHRKKGYKKLHT